MFCHWYETDSDCAQHMRNDGTVYEMIQTIWLDTTREDRARGLHEYCVVRGDIDLNDYSEEEMEGYINSYCYTLDGLKAEYGNDMWGIVAECILEEVIVCDSCVISDVDSFDDARKIIEEIAGKED